VPLPMPVDSAVTPLAPVVTLVDSRARLLLVVLWPVDEDATPLCVVLMAVEVEVDSESTLLLIVLRTVESDADAAPPPLVPGGRSRGEARILATDLMARSVTA